MTYTIESTDTFNDWLDNLRDRQAYSRILQRLDQIKINGHFGDHKSVGDGVSELRIHAGAGYRVYYTQRGGRLIILLAGGDKDSQTRDIARAKQFNNELE